MAHALLSGPSKDDGYDITDFYGSTAGSGATATSSSWCATARAHGIRVILDFVMNHTSDQHPWFKSARRSVDDPYRDYFVEPDEAEDQPQGHRLPDQEDSLWELEPTDRRVLPAPLLQAPAGPQRPQPQSRRRSPDDRLLARARVSGFRVDAVPFLFSTDSAPEGSEGTTVSFDPKRYLGDVRKYVTRRLGDAVLLGEVNLPYRR